MSFPGHELRARRLELSLSIDGAAAGSAVPASMIAALEDASLDSLPAPCYTVGFIRSYCRQLGLEPEYYVSALHVALHGRANAEQNRESMVTRLLRKIPFPNLPMVTTELQAWVLVIGATALGWAAYSAVVGPGNPHSSPQAQAATVDLRLPGDLDQD